MSRGARGNQDIFISDPDFKISVGSYVWASAVVDIRESARAKDYSGGFRNGASDDYWDQ